ncbi:AMP-binding protein [Cumulibacter soli]|uniref:AMP-binding protein n=1 Tax=Cumulibacter soli TaxID=2546344 RepID=UPI001067A722|nr:AMP-binding protein [Cumulibacter soli]
MHVPTPTDEAIAHWTSTGDWVDELLDGYLARAAREIPDSPAVIRNDVTVTFGELDAQVTKAAAMLQSCGVLPGEVVTWQLPNWIEAIELHNAVLRCGAISNPVVPIYRERELAFILRQAESRVLVVPSYFRKFDYGQMGARLQADISTLQTVITVGDGPTANKAAIDYKSACINASGQPDTVARDANQPALLLFTSGTTANPKGVVHTHNTLGYKLRNEIAVWDLTSDDVIYMPSPVGHITGISMAASLPQMIGAPAVLQDVWSAEEGVDLIERYRCKFTMGATPFLHGILTESEKRGLSTSSLRLFVCGGAEVPAGLVRDASDRLDCFITRVWGSTEFPLPTGCAPGDPVAKAAETDGRLLGAESIRIIAPDGSELGAGEAGEVQVTGPELMVGYLDPELNESAFTSDGWFRSGDLGYLDDDGYLTITGRIKDIIIRGGENISAKEVEDLLFEHPTVDEVAVVGKPDDVMGERVCAVVVPAHGQQPDLGDLVTFLRAEGIANQKLPEHLVIVDDLPRTASGKIQKFQLRQQLKGK